VIGYLLGGIPTGLLIGRARGVDLRAHGSRNIGATNAFRVLGARWGAAVFALDVLKGFVAASIPWFLLGVRDGMQRTSQQSASENPTVALLPAILTAGIAAILGHVFTPWLRFRGGRGVATSLGVFLAIMPVPTLLAFLLWAILFALSRRVSVGSIGAAFAYPFLVFWLAGDLPRGAVTSVAAAVAGLVIVRHLPNIRRLLSGTEPRTMRAPKGERP
jgi:acyl phosphate:glycerol-3-phosphate acyltransferase